MRFGALEIEDRRRRIEPGATSAGVRLAAEVAWKVGGPTEYLRAIAEALPDSMTELLGPVLLLDFGNAVGRFPVPHLGLIEVVSGKWSEADFEAMLAELTERMAALPFSAGDAARLPYDRQLAAHREVLYQAFVYLRHVLSDVAPRHVRLGPSLEAILREPHSRLISAPRRTPLDRAGTVDLAYLHRLAAGAEPVVRAPARAGALPIAQALRGYVPQEVEEARVLRDFDTAENRFAKTFLELAQAVIVRMEALAEAGAKKRSWRSVRADCRNMRRALAPYRRAPLWEEVGAMRHLPAGSTVLQRRRGYREVYRHFLRLRATSRLPLTEGDLEDLLEMKDIAALYELWCYFEVVRAVSTELGAQPVRADRFGVSQTQVAVPWDFHVAWKTGVRCFYNLRFSRSRPADRRTYSVPLRPDIVLEVPGAGLHIFDAKFKLRGTGAWNDEEDTEDQRTTFKRADLYKMHTYRDALPSARSVRILYPGDRSVFHDSGRADPGRDGVGAVGLSPGSIDELGRVIRSLLGSG